MCLNKCVICLRYSDLIYDNDKIQTRCCMNFYCKKCLKHWSKVFETITFPCPTCRQPLNKLDCGFFISVKITQIKNKLLRKNKKQHRMSV